MEGKEGVSARFRPSPSSRRSSKPRGVKVRPVRALVRGKADPCRVSRLRSCWCEAFQVQDPREQALDRDDGDLLRLDMVWSSVRRFVWPAAAPLLTLATQGSHRRLPESPRFRRSSRELDRSSFFFLLVPVLDLTRSTPRSDGSPTTSTPLSTLVSLPPPLPPPKSDSVRPRLRTPTRSSWRPRVPRSR